MEVVIALIGGAVTLFVTALGYWGAKKSGLGETQQKLIKNLQDIIEVQNTKIGILEKDAEDRDSRITLLENQLKILRRLTIRQAAIITKLMNGSPELASLLEAEVESGVEDA